MDEEVSDFGKGFSYCLGLFLAHADRKYYNNPSQWFNGAGDHIFEFETGHLVGPFKARCDIFKDKVIHWRVDGNPTEDDKKWALQEAKDLLREWDSMNGITTVKGSWE